MPAACTASQSRSHKWCKLLDLTTGKMVFVDKRTGLSPDQPNHVNDYVEPLPAAQHFRKAAEAGNAEAQHKLALCYSKGFGVVQNLERAFEFHLKAAHQGLATAAYYLGGCYLHGWGVSPPSLRLSAFWYRAAATRGSRPAITALREPRVANALALLTMSEADETRTNEFGGRGPFTNQELEERSANYDAGLGTVTDAEILERQRNSTFGWGEGSDAELTYCLQLAMDGDVQVICDLVARQGWDYRCLLTARCPKFDSAATELPPLRIAQQPSQAEMKNEKKQKEKARRSGDSGTRGLPTRFGALGTWNSSPAHPPEEPRQKPILIAIPVTAGAAQMHNRPHLQAASKNRKNVARQQYEYQKHYYHRHQQKKSAMALWKVDEDLDVHRCTAADVARSYGHTGLAQFLVGAIRDFRTNEQAKGEAKAKEEKKKNSRKMDFLQSQSHRAASLH